MEQTIQDLQAFLYPYEYAVFAVIVLTFAYGLYKVWCAIEDFRATRFIEANSGVDEGEDG